jgi:hypothetical protein
MLLCAGMRPGGWRDTLCDCRLPGGTGLVCRDSGDVGNGQGRTRDYMRNFPLRVGRRDGRFAHVLHGADGSERTAGSPRRQVETGAPRMPGLPRDGAGAHRRAAPPSGTAGWNVRRPGAVPIAVRSGTCHGTLCDAAPARHARQATAPPPETTACRAQRCRRK